MQASDVQLRTYSGEAVPVVGVMEVDVRYQDQQTTLPLLVVKGKWTIVAGKELADDHSLGLEQHPQSSERNLSGPTCL